MHARAPTLLIGIISKLCHMFYTQLSIHKSLLQNINVKYMREFVFNIHILQAALSCICSGRCRIHIYRSLVCLSNVRGTNVTNVRGTKVLKKHFIIAYDTFLLNLFQAHACFFPLGWPLSMTC